MAAWYIARANELLLDVDRAMAPTKAGGPPRLDAFVRRRVRDAVLARKLDVKRLVVAPSYSPGNRHVLITMGRSMPMMERLIWQAWLGSDLYRARADLMRAAMGHLYPSLLVAPRIIPEWRAPNAICPCEGKHAIDGSECKAWRRFRGPSPWECFGKPSTSVSEGWIADIGIGEMPQAMLMRVD